MSPPPPRTDLLISVVYIFFFGFFKLYFSTCVDVTKLWFSDGLQPKQLWFETKTSVVEIRAHSNDTQSGRWKNKLTESS